MSVVRAVTLSVMTAMTHAPMVRDPARDLYDHAAGLLASARALEAAARAPGASAALGPTLACVEASLEALAQDAEHLSEHALGERSQDADRDVLATRGEAEQRFTLLVAALADARVACAASRTSAGLVLHAGRSR